MSSEEDPIARPYRKVKDADTGKISYERDERQVEDRDPAVVAAADRIIDLIRCQSDLKHATEIIQGVIDKVLAQRIKHCEICGGDWVDNGLQSGCMCIKSQAQAKLLERCRRHLADGRIMVRLLSGQLKDKDKQIEAIARAASESAQASGKVIAGLEAKQAQRDKAWAELVHKAFVDGGDRCSFWEYSKAKAKLTTLMEGKA